MELSVTFVFFNCGAMHPDYVTYLTHNRAFFKSSGIYNHNREFIVFDALIALRAASSVDNFERADPLALITLDRVCRVNDHTVDVDLLVEFVCVQRMVLHPFAVSAYC